MVKSPLTMKLGILVDKARFLFNKIKLVLLISYIFFEFGENSSLSLFLCGLLGIP